MDPNFLFATLIIICLFSFCITILAIVSRKQATTDKAIETLGAHIPIWPIPPADEPVLRKSEEQE